jgi:hypothetical protein
MAITFGHFTDGSFSNTTSQTWNHDCTGDDYLLVIVQGQGGNANITGVTYNGAAMTYIGENAPDATTNVAWYGIVAPATGSNAIVISKTAGNYGVAESISFSGVDQATPSTGLAASRILPTASPNGIAAFSMTMTAGSHVVVTNGLQSGATLTAGTGLTHRGGNGFETSVEVFSSTSAASSGSNSFDVVSSAYDGEYVGVHRLEILAAAGGGGSDLGGIITGRLVNRGVLQGRLVA